MRLERLLDTVLQLIIRQIVDVANAQSLFNLRLALLGQEGGTVLFLDDVVARVRAIARLLSLDHLASLHFRDGAVHFVVLVRRFLART